MSRYSAHGDRYGLAYGVDGDPTIGPFVMVWDKSICSEPDCDSVIVDLDNLSGAAVTPEMVVALADRYGVPLRIEQVESDMADRPAPPQRDPQLQRVLDRFLAVMPKQNDGARG